MLVVDCKKLDVILLWNIQHMLGILPLAVDIAPEYSVPDEIVYVLTIDSCSTGFPYAVEYVKIMGYTEKCITGNKK